MAEIKHGSFGVAGQATPEPKKEERKMAVPDLRSLIELGCIKDSIQIGDLEFQMRSLSASERLETGKFLGEDPDINKLFEFNLLTLALSIESVNGVPLEQLFAESGQSADDPLTARKAILTSMQQSVLAKLLAFYGQITDRSDAKFSTEQAKN